MDWPELIEGDDDDFADVLYTEEEAEAIMGEAMLKMRLASLRAAESLKAMGRAAKGMAETVGRIRDNYVLSQDKVEG